MKERTNDDERLAALLDGRLDERRRLELLAELAASDEDYQVFVKTASVLRALEAEDAAADAPDGVVPLRRRPRAPGWPLARRWIALAAVVAGLLLAGPALLRQRTSAEADPLRLASRLEGGLPAGWDERPWSSPRGGNSAPGGEQAVQAGALLVDLAVAVRARDTSAIHTLSTQLWRRFDSGAAASPFRRISERPGAPADSLRGLVARGTDRLSGRPGRQHLELGAWVEAARLAARGHNDEFFRTRSTRAMLRRAEKLTTADAAVARVRGALPANGPPRWEALQPALDDLMRQLAGG